jgi:hypothetical protein
MLMAVSGDFGDQVVLFADMLDHAIGPSRPLQPICRNKDLVIRFGRDSGDGGEDGE